MLEVLASASVLAFGSTNGSRGRRVHLDRSEIKGEGAALHTGHIG